MQHPRPTRIERHSDRVVRLTAADTQRRSTVEGLVDDHGDASGRESGRHAWHVVDTDGGVRLGRRSKVHIGTEVHSQTFALEPADTTSRKMSLVRNEFDGLIRPPQRPNA